MASCCGSKTAWLLEWAETFLVGNDSEIDTAECDTPVFLHQLCFRTLIKALDTFTPMLNPHVCVTSSHQLFINSSDRVCEKHNKTGDKEEVFFHLNY